MAPQRLTNSVTLRGPWGASQTVRGDAARKFKKIWKEKSCNSVTYGSRRAAGGLLKQKCSMFLTHLAQLHKREMLHIRTRP